MSSEVIITISRRPGCGGVEIGQRMAARCNAVYVDKKTLTKASEGLDAVLRESQDTKARKSFWELLGQTPILQEMESYIPEFRSIVSDAPVSEQEEEILLELVGDGPAVVLGRAGFYRFRDYPKAVHFFLGAEREYRIQNYMRLYQLSAEEAEDLISTTDRATERYIHKVSGKDMLDLRNYDLAMDVGKIDLDQAVGILLDYVNARLGTLF